jgi:hypothetical protein
MRLNSEFKKSLLESDGVFASRNKTPLNKDYKIGGKISFDRAKHWIVYDFINERIFKRTIDKLNLMGDFAENYFKDEKGVDITFDMPSYVVKNSTELMSEIQIPEGKYILVIMKSESPESESLSLEDFVWYNVYHTFAQNKIFYRKPSEIASIKYNLVPALHWVWFRRGVDKLNPRIIQRAKTWIEQNPELTFHLWTNINNEEELKDFLSDIPEESRESFFGANGVIVHFKSETWSEAKEFCDENFSILKESDSQNPSKNLRTLSPDLTSSKILDNPNLWDFISDVLENTQDKASMIFKTDILRCMILYMRGGWYTDFNDTYCFVPLKYSVHPDKKNLIYIANDFAEKLNNYILYSPKNNSKWLELTEQIIQKSYSVYQVLKTKDETFTKVMRSILKSFITSVSESTESGLDDKPFCELIDFKMGVWLNLLNTESTKMLERQGLKLPCDLHLNSNTLMLFFRYIFSYIKKDSVLSDRISYELGHMSSLNLNRKNVYQVRWKYGFKEHTSSDEHGKNLRKGAIKEIEELWRDMVFPEDDMYSTLIYANVNKMLTITNMGMYFYENVENLKHAYIFPLGYCYSSLSWISSITHIADGTSCSGPVHASDI